MSGRYNAVIGRTCVTLETAGCEGDVATLILYWQATPIGRKGGLAFQTTELVPFNEGDDDIIKQLARERVAADARGECYAQYLQGAKLIWRDKNNQVIYKIPRPD